MTGLEMSERVDQSLRLKIRAESNNANANNFYNEVVLVTGRIDLSKVPADLTDDQGAYRVNGAYQKIELTGSAAHNFGDMQSNTVALRWHGLASSTNLDSFNKISLGGISGVRAFSSIDGVGDQGAILSCDVTHQFMSNFYGGVLYDVGKVKAHRKNFLPNIDDNNAYSLRGAGLQVGGTCLLYTSPSPRDS